MVIKVAERQGLTTPSTSVQHRARLKCRYTIVHVTRKGDLAGPQAGLFFLTEGYRPLHRGRQPRVLKRNPSAIVCGMGPCYSDIGPWYLSTLCSPLSPVRWRTASLGEEILSLISG